MTRHVLSLWQPWATLCVVRDPLRHEVAKQIETRAYRPQKYGISPPLEVAIHATKGFNWEQRKVCEDETFLRALNARGYFSGAPTDRCRMALAPLPLGCIIGVATIVNLLPADDPALLFVITETEKKFGLYQGGRWAWVLEHQRELPSPIPWRGRQQVLYTLPEEVNAQIDLQLGSTLAQPVPSQQNSHD